MVCLQLAGVRCGNMKYNHIAGGQTRKLQLCLRNIAVEDIYGPLKFVASVCMCGKTDGR
jgi:hypothetical protein